MVTVRELNQPSTSECGNCNRESTEHYIVNGDVIVKPACTYCLDTVIRALTSEYFTVESLETYVEMKDDIYDLHVNIEPLGRSDIQQLIEDTFIHEVGVVNMNNRVFDKVTITSGTFEKSIDKLQNEGVVRTFEIDEVDDGEKSTDSKTVVEPSLERQGELMNTLDLVSKWRMQSTPAVVDSVVDERIERVTDNTEFKENDFL